MVEVQKIVLNKKFTDIFLTKTLFQCTSINTNIIKNMCELLVSETHCKNKVPSLEAKLQL